MALKILTIQYQELKLLDYLAGSISWVVTIDASQSTGSSDDVLEVNAFQFSSRTDLIFIGSDDKDVNVKFTGGSGDDTLTTGKITEDEVTP